ncbi:MAG: NAD(P)-binding domain-containing protein [Spirochaeta sp.]|jgi:thioredoxin reductase (NADPH)|nr:NAD(P)-binding domain-containing protein [Spirochaeta sp.]
MNRDESRREAAHDVLLVGAGPAGLAAAAHFRQAGLDLLHVEEGELAQTIRRFPTGVRLFSTRATLALPGFPFGPDPDTSPTREEYIAYLEESAAAAGLHVETATTAVSAEAVQGRYRVDLRGPDGARRTADACSVVVASGGYFFPNILGIPGEDRPHVHHYFRSEIVSPNERMVVVGGRNSAIEAAVNIAETGAEALLVYRKSRLPRSKIKPWLLPRLDTQIRAGRIRVRYRSVPLEVTPRGVVLRDADGNSPLQPADAIFLLTGYGPDYRLLRGAGIRFHKRTVRPLFTEGTLETRSPGIFVCGTVALRLRGEDATIENSRDHALLMLDSIRARCRAF